MRPGKIFLVGCPRSGTSATQAAIVEHPLIVSAPETMLFRAMMRFRRQKEGGTVGGNNLRRIFLDRLKFSLGLANTETKKRLLRLVNEVCPDSDIAERAKQVFTNRAAVRCFVATMDNLAGDRNAELWLEKTPDHVNYIDCIQRHIPEARFIHLIRNGADTVASLYDASKKYPNTHWAKRYNNIARCCDRWITSVRDTIRFADEPTSHYLIEFEQFVRSPDREMQNLDVWLQVQPRSKLTTLVREGVAKSIVRKDEPWKAGVGQSIRKPASKFSTVFSVIEQQKIASTLFEAQSEITQFIKNWKRQN